MLHLFRLAVSGVAIAIFSAVPGTAVDHPYSLGGFGGVANLTGGDFLSYDYESSFGFTIGHQPHERWQISLTASWFELTNDTSAEFTGTFGELSNTTPATFDGTRLALTVNRLWLPASSVINLKTGAGGGLLIWKVEKPDSGTVFAIDADRGGLTDFSATELILSANAGLVIRPAVNFSLTIEGYGDYLTGAGTDFASEVNSVRNRYLVGGAVTFNLHFGGSGGTTSEWRSEQQWTAEPRPVTMVSADRRDADGDGVVDGDDKCLDTPRGAFVDRDGCPIDTDRDGVADGLDDCPGTPPQAHGKVDIYGCPVDSDFDGLADYRDDCPFNEAGAEIDSNGCPIDDDGDGVPNGLDDCPNTLVGVEVDRYGCIDLSQFAEPMVLNIDYPSGSFEVDPNNKERLRKLAGILTFVTDLKLEINGYTDNIGTASANSALSEKRARRARDLLVANGVAPERIKVFGRGEANPIASNQSAAGRAKNRRIEIVFYR